MGGSTTRDSRPVADRTIAALMKGMLNLLNVALDGFAGCRVIQPRGRAGGDRETAHEGALTHPVPGGTS
jgi:hypothetical protein